MINQAIFFNVHAYRNAFIDAKKLKSLFKKTHPDNYLSFLIICYGYITSSSNTLEEDYDDFYCERNTEHFWMCFCITISKIIGSKKFNTEMANAIDIFFIDYKYTHPGYYDYEDSYLYYLGYELYSDFDHVVEEVISNLSK